MFLRRLNGISDPEEKRKIIGASFIEVFDKEASNIDGVRFLAQGTLYPDVIESISAAGGSAVTIKSHHNVGGLPDDMALELVEPLRELFKDEVRDLGLELGLPASLVGRHPFQALALLFAFQGILRLKSWVFCAPRMRCIWMKLEKLDFIMKSGRHLPFCCLLKPSVLWAMRGHMNMFVPCVQLPPAMV